MKVKINIKKLTPTLSIGAAAAATTPLIISQCQKSTNAVVVNNYIGKEAPSSKPPSGKTIKIKGLPALNINSGESLGAAWRQYLLHSDNSKRWVENEKELLKSPGNSPTSHRIRSEMFKEAKRKVQNSKKISGGEIHKVCKRAYKMKEISKSDRRVIKDVWHYCQGRQGSRRGSGANI